MKKFRSKEKGPLPIGLRSGSISVASRGYFLVDDDDLQSPDLLKRIKQKLVEPVVEKAAKDASKPASGSTEGQEVRPIPKSTDESKELKDVMEDEKHDDSLTMLPEMVESECEKADSGDTIPVGAKKGKRRQKSGGRKKQKEGITG